MVSFEPRLLPIVASRPDVAILAMRSKGGVWLQK